MRACDNCRIRKVKCDHAQPSCSQCLHFRLPCSTTSPTQKRKNPIRGRLVARARGDNDLSHWETGAATGAETQTQHVSTHQLDTSSPCFSVSFFEDLLPQYEQLVYPVNPIIPPDEIHESIGNMFQSFEDLALVYAFGSVTVFLVQGSPMTSEIVEKTMDYLMQRSLEAHRRADLHVRADGRMSQEPHVTIKRIMTCIFLEISMMAFKRLGRSFGLLREAIAMIQILAIQGLPDEGPKLARYQRVYYEAYIHERFLTLSTGYPSILPPLEARLPRPDPTLPQHIELGFNRLVCLFLIMDQSFLGHWLVQRDLQHTTPGLTLDWLESKQLQLDDDETDAFLADNNLKEQGYVSLTEFQKVDLFITRLWMRTLVWQLALSRGLLQSSPPDNIHIGLSLQFPARRMTAQLSSPVSRLESVASIQMQGSGIAQKLFEITSTAAEVLALPWAHDQYHRQGMSAQVDDFVFLVRFLLEFERIHKSQRDYLQEKLESLAGLYPDININNLY